MKSLAERLTEIEELERSLIRDYANLMSAGSLWQSDMVTIGAIKRSLGLAAGFRKMIEEQNFTCAAPLVRLQLDCALRLSAMAAVDHPEEYASAFLGGAKMDRFKSSDGEKLTDRFLVNRMKEDFPWVEGVYNDTCELVHLSARALWNSVTKTDDDTRVAYFQISATDPIRGGEEKYFEAVAAFKASFLLTHEIAKHYLSDRKIKMAAQSTCVAPEAGT